KTEKKTDNKKEIRRKRSQILAERSKALKPIEEKIEQIENNIENIEKKINELNEAVIKASIDKDSSRIKELSQNICKFQQILDNSFDELQILTDNIDSQKQFFEKQLSQIE
ncbi:MAG: ABC transporter ATP-binding protein, partial [Desulfobacterales bacterium]|nr:ABC transporter ATP-binding protein [Desulfobacterales bacterium]